MNYTNKSNDSFKARLRFYLYYCVTKSKDANVEEFLTFDIDTPEYEQYVLEYTSVYHQEERTHIITGKNLDDIYSEIKSLEKRVQPFLTDWKTLYQKEVFEKKLPITEFNKLVDKVKDCHYCGISIDEIKQLRSQRQLFKKNESGYTLELDRKLPNREYSVENCVMACYWCNNAKTDEFTEEEFQPMGVAIGEALRARIK